MPTESNFGEYVHGHRKALDLTQEELARRVGCATVTLRKIEYGTLRPSVQIAELLAMALRIPLGERGDFVRFARTSTLNTPEPPPTPTFPPKAEEIGSDSLEGRGVRGYELAERIGSGGFGAVYRAIQTGVDREVAVKIILPQYANHPEFIRRFETEAFLVARLEHPYIIPLYDFWREPSAAYLVMRLMRGGSLADRLKNGPLAPEFVLKILTQIGSALNNAHRYGVIHRDLKPANILLDEDDNAYLADFGVAKNLGSMQETDLEAESNLLGSPAYTSPEQIRSEPVRPQADIYCLGIMLYELLTGTQPFKGPTPIDFIIQHLNAPLPSLKEGFPELPAVFNDVIQRATAKDPNERYADVLDMMAVIEAGMQANRQGSRQEIPGEMEGIEYISPAEIENPFKGLQAFSEADAEDFFGRENLIQTLLGRLTADEPESLGVKGLARFLAVVGPSGSGKSSVVKAGLLPAIRRGALPGSENWFIVDIVPGKNPFEELESGLLRIATNSSASLKSQLQDSERGLLRAVRQILPEEPSIELVLVIDQFEEVFTLVRDEEVRKRFLENLVNASLDDSSRLHIILTMRADFTDRPLGYVDFGDLMRQRTEFVLPLTIEELESAIEGPARKAGLQLEQGLTTRIINELGNQPGTLPMLQYALTEMFEHRDGAWLRLDAYNEIGGVLGALGSRAEEIYTALDEDSQDILRQLFLRLVNPGEGTNDSRLRVLRSTLEGLSFGEFKGDFESRISKIIHYFGRYRLFTFDHDPITRGSTIEVAHEALLREWDRLRGWLDEHRVDIRMQRSLGQLALSWKENEKDASYLLRGSRLDQFTGWLSESKIALTTDERDFVSISLEERNKEEEAEIKRKAILERLQTRSRNILRALVGVFALATVVALVLMSFAFSQRKLAETASADRATQQAIAEEQAEIANQQRIVAEEERDARATQQAIVEEQSEQISAQAAIEQRNAELNRSLYLASQSQIAFQAGNLELALALAWESVQIDDPPGKAQLALSQSAYAKGGVEKVFSIHEEKINSLQISPDGTRALSGDEIGSLLYWDVASGEVIENLEGHEGFVQHAVFSPDGTKALSTGELYEIIYWDLETGAQLDTLKGHFSAVRSLDFSPDGRYAVSGSGWFGDLDETDVFDFSLRIWDLATGEELCQWVQPEEGRPRGISNVAFHPAGTKVAAAMSLTGIVLFDAATCEQTAIYGNNQEILDEYGYVREEGVFPPDYRFLAFDESGQNLFTALSENLPMSINLDTGTYLIFEAGNLGGDARYFSLRPDGQRLLIGSTIVFVEYDIASGAKVYESEVGLALESAYAADGRSVFLGYNNGQVREVALDYGALVDGPGFPELSSYVRDLKVSPDGRTALVTDGHVGGYGMLIDLDTGEALWRYDPPVGGLANLSGVWAVAFHPDNETGLLNYYPGLAGLDLGTGEVVYLLGEDGQPGHAQTGAIDTVAVHPDGIHALSGSQTGEIIYWNTETTELVWKVDSDLLAGPVFRVAISPDGQTAISVGFDVQHWNLEDGSLIQNLQGHTNHIWDVRFLDDETAITASHDGSLILWNLTSAEAIRTYLGHTGRVRSVSVSADGRLAISGDREGGVILWDVETGEPLRQYEGGQYVEFFPDGLKALNHHGSELRYLRIDATIESLLAWVHANRVVRELTCAERQIYNLIPLCEIE